MSKMQTTLIPSFVVGAHKFMWGGYGDLKIYSKEDKLLIHLERDTLTEVSKQMQDGFCAFCFNEIPANDKLCCECANEVYMQHKLNCLCEIGR